MLCDELVFFKQVFIVLKLLQYNFLKNKSFTISISLSHTLKAFVPYGYVSIPLDACILISTHL